MRQDCQNAAQSVRYVVASLQWLWLWPVPFRKLGDTSVSVLGDCLSVAVIQQRPKDVLDKMDELQWV